MITKGKDIYYREKRQDLSNAMGSMYAACLFLGIENAMAAQPVVAVERTVFYRERAAGMYSALPYAVGQVSDVLHLKLDDLKKHIQNYVPVWLAEAGSGFLDPFV